MSQREYIVSLKRGVDYDQFWKDMEFYSSVPTVPSREVEIVNNRDLSQRICHYSLTDEEAELLRNDLRVYAVEAPTKFKPFKSATQVGNFDKTISDIGNNINWGLARSNELLNPFTVSGAFNGPGYNYTLDGSGVDVVIQDSGLQVDHPEFIDSNGNSRVQQIDWYVASGLFTPGPINLETDNRLVVSTNSFISATRAANASSGFAPSLIGPALVLGGGDGAADDIRGGVSDSGKAYRIRFEGCNTFTDAVNTDDVIWEVKFLDNGWIQILVVRHDSASSRTWRLQNDSGTAVNLSSVFQTTSLQTVFANPKSCVLTTSDGITWQINDGRGTASNYRAQLVSGEWTLVQTIAPQEGFTGIDPLTISQRDDSLIRFNTPFSFNFFVAETSPQSAQHYQDTDGHGTHVAGIAAGRTYGWAKNAKLYAVKVDGLDGGEGGGIPYNNGECFDVIKGWHLNKPIDPTTGKRRPTIVNMSWGFGDYFSGITGGVYRGTPWTGTSRRTDYGMVGTFTSGLYRHGAHVASVDVDIQEMIDAGIHVCIAAGNTTQKIDVVGGVDYNNYYVGGYFNGPNPNYYHRGSSPWDDQALVVGCLSDSPYSSNTALEKRSSFSETGPGVDLYAPGENIMSATSNSNSFTDANYGVQGSAPYNIRNNPALRITDSSVLPFNTLSTSAVRNTNGYFTPASVGAALVLGAQTNQSLAVGVTIPFTIHGGLEDSGRRYRIRFAGNTDSSTNASNVTIKYEISFFNNNWIEILFLRHDNANANRSVPPASGQSNKLSYFQLQDNEKIIVDMNSHFRNSELQGSNATPRSCVLSTTDGVNWTAINNARVVFSGGSFSISNSIPTERGVANLSVVYDRATQFLGYTGISNCPPTFDFYAPGRTTARQMNISGTSMASPQVCGLGAIILQLNPGLTPVQLKNYLVANCSTAMFNVPGVNNDYTNSESIIGGEPRILRNSFNSAINFSITNFTSNSS